MKRLLVSLALLAACDVPTVPARAAAYAFDDGTGEVFHWPATHLPVRFYADTRGPMPTLVTRSIKVWEATFLYGEFRGVVTTDSTMADVVVRWSGTVPADVPPDSGPPITACNGLTRFIVDSATHGLDSAVVITAQRLAVTATDAQVIACFRRVIAHEVGHSLGLLQHSPDPGDLMAPQPLVDRASQRDRATVEVLYHTQPTIGPPPR